MRRTHRALRGVVAIHSRQTPVLVLPPAITQTTNVGKSAQQPRDRAQGIRFKVIESGF
jgi:hypothetical protein